MKYKALFRKTLTSLLVCGACVWSGYAAQAQTSFTVSLNTAPLQAMSGHTFSLDFQLNDGSPAGGDGNNTATVSLFQFGTGSATAGTESLFGGASGDLNSSVVVTDSSFLNEFTQDFTPGSLLTFHVTLTNHVGSGEDTTSGGTPDLFSFSILDNGAEISSDPSGALLSVALTGTGGPNMQSFAADRAHGGIEPAIQTSALVPDTASWALWVSGMAGFILMRKKSR